MFKLVHYPPKNSSSFKAIISETEKKLQTGTLPITAIRLEALPTTGTKSTSHICSVHYIKAVEENTISTLLLHYSLFWETMKSM